MAEQFKIYLIWADELARLGTTLHVLPELESVGIPLATCKLMHRNRAFSMANDRLSMGLDGFKSKLMWPMLNMKKTIALLSLNRPDVALVVSAVTGHCLIGEHARRLRSLSNDFCRSCGDEEKEESVEHLLCKCPALSSRRNSTHFSLMS